MNISSRPDARSHLNDLEQFGFVVVEGILSDKSLQHLRRLLDELAAAELGDGSAWTSNGNQKIFNLINKKKDFLDLASHPQALMFAEHFLGDNPLLSSFVANITKPGNTAQALHCDQQYVPSPWSHVHAFNLLWVVDTFTAENGGTVVVPGSHRFGYPPDDNVCDVDQLSVEAPAGSLVILDGRLWHGAGQFKSKAGQRRAILAHYCAPYIRQQENVFRSLNPARVAKLNMAERKLLGYDVWSGLGVVDGLPREWQGRQSRSGPTNRDGIFPT